MIRRLLPVVRFFIVVPVVPRGLLAAFALAALVGGATLVFGLDEGTRTMAPVLLLQLFAAASGFVVPARRGHYDLLLTGGSSRLAIAAVHWIMSVLPGVLSWLALAALERALGGNRLFAGNTLLAVFVVSTLPWAVTVPLPRLTGGIAWLLAFALVAAALPGADHLPVNLLLPWGLLNAPLQPVIAAITVACGTAAMASAFSWINRVDIPLESSQ
jgi:hypothetical protein